MSEQITIYGSGGNRAARVAWTVNELGLEASYRHYDGMIGSDELRRLHPQAKIPAMQIGDLVLFESAAICQHLCDITAGQRLLAPVGTPQRSLHNQWVSFAQSEVEAYLWHSFRASRLHPSLKTTEFPLSFNNESASAGLQVLSNRMESTNFLLGENFSVADIIVGWTVNWAIKMSLVEPKSSLHDYLARLKARDACALS